MIVKTRILTQSLVIFLLSILSLGIIGSSSHAYAQQQSLQHFPSSIIAASSTETTPHALKLKATQQEEAGAEE
ncbi:MAG: hypothetical protein M3297_11700 [Thermoproteota archaeon]|nr:hypothetical protein [Thermoproteota archaeon]